MDHDRLNNEREFHNKEFGNGGRKFVNSFYAANLEVRDSLGNFISINGKGNDSLVIGCGLDTWAISFCSAGAKTTAIDISDVAIEQTVSKAKECGINGDQLICLRMNAEQLEFGDQSFDVTLGSAILHHLHVENTIKGLARVLRSGGKMIFAEPLAKNPFIYLFRKLTPSLRTVDEKPLNVEDIKVIFKYFEKVECRYYYLFSFAFAPLARFPILNLLARFANFMDRLLLDNIKLLHPYAWQVVIIASNPKR